MEMFISLHKDGDRTPIHGWLLCSAGGSLLECEQVDLLVFLNLSSVCGYRLYIPHQLGVVVVVGAMAKEEHLVPWQLDSTHWDLHSTCCKIKSIEWLVDSI